MYYIVSEICIAGRFLEGCFYCYSQQIISAVAKESLNPYNFIQRAPETQNLSYWNTESNKKKKCKIRLNNKNTCKILCEMQYLKDRL